MLLCNVPCASLYDVQGQALCLSCVPRAFVHCALCLALRLRFFTVRATHTPWNVYFLLSTALSDARVALLSFLDSLF